jgi:hypothetical protein
VLKLLTMIPVKGNVKFNVILRNVMFHFCHSPEEIIQEIFERCGEMTTIRLSKKNFCHIRFVFESSVDAAIYLSGE